jgi:hypothetical protein
MPSSRRAFLAACGAAVASGCVARGPETPRYQLVAGVEWKTLRGTRGNTVEKIAENRPVDPPVVDAAPVDLGLRTVGYDETVVDLSGPGPLALNTSTREAIRSGYGDPYAVVVLTLYNRDPYNGVPKGNSTGYRVGFDGFDRLDPGDRLSATIDRERDLPAIETVLTVDSASGTAQRDGRETPQDSRAL